MSWIMMPSWSSMARTLDRPVNYALAPDHSAQGRHRSIRSDVPLSSSTRAPAMGRDIGGFKADSEMASPSKLATPVYFIGFLPNRLRADHRGISRAPKPIFLDKLSTFTRKPTASPV